jgi:hypothetical protein
MVHCPEVASATAVPMEIVPSKSSTVLPSSALPERVKEPSLS